MEGPYKRIKIGNDEYDPRDIARLPVDVRVHILTRVERLRDLFTLARHMPLMKAFMKEKDVFGKWFRYHTGFTESESDQVDAYVTLIIKQLDGIGNDPLGVEWYTDDDYIYLSVKNDNSIVFETNMSRVRNMFKNLGLKISSQKYKNGDFDATVQCDTEPMLQLVKIARWIDKHFPDLEYNLLGLGNVSFKHTLPFDLLALCQLPKNFERIDELRLQDYGLAKEGNTEKFGVVPKVMHSEEIRDPVEIYTRLVQGLTTREWTVKQVFH